MAAVAVACLVAVLRWLMLAGLAGALGGLAGRGLARQYKGTVPAPLPPPWALRSSLLGLAATAALTIVIFSLRALLTLPAHPAVASLLTTGQGALTGIECAGFALAAAALRLRQPGLSVLPLLGVVLAEAIRAHPEGIVPVGGALLSVVHVLPALMWAGMLAYTLRAALAWRHDPPAMRGLVRLYANAAVWLFAVVVLTGVVTALVLVPLGSLLSTAYGIMVIIKAVLVAVVAVAAIAGRAWLGRVPETGGAGPAGGAGLGAERRSGGSGGSPPRAGTGDAAGVLRAGRGAGRHGRAHGADAARGPGPGGGPGAGRARGGGNRPAPAGLEPDTVRRPPTGPGWPAPSPARPAPRRRAAPPPPGCPAAAGPATG